MSEEQKTETRMTAADIKKQIQAKTEELKNSGLPITGQVANEINANQSTPASTTKVEVKPEPQIEAVKRLEEPKPVGENQVDLKEWAKKKGIDWTTEDSVLAALRKSDEAFHKRQQERKMKEPANQPGYIPPPYTNQQPPAYAPNPPYYPSQAPVNNRTQLSNLARIYNMPEEDVERLIAFNRDFFQAVSEVERQKISKEMDEIKRENQKNSVFRELSSDPAFRRPEVAVEFSKVLEEMQNNDPHSFEVDPNAYLRAYDKTLINIARRNLEGQPLQEGIPPIARPPLTPPRPLGQASGGGALESESGIDIKAFSKASVEEKARILEGMGIRPGR